MPTSELTYISISNTDNERARAVQAIYDAGFRDDERHPFAQLHEELTRPRSGVRATLGAFELNGEVVAMGSALHYAEINLGYLLYLAVRPDLHGRGYGAQVVRFLLDWADEQARETLQTMPWLTFWEVRHPAAAADEAERLENERRVRFYQQLGAMTVPITYICPSIGPGLPDMNYLPMIYTYPPGRSLTRGEALDLAWWGVVRINGADPKSEYWAAALRSVEANWPE
jgi:GNAT superfamily N-acetyltransferase